MSRRLPWVKWSYADWLNEHALLLCTYAARGLWADLLALMYHSPEPGYLLIAGDGMTPEQIAKLRGGTADEVAVLLGELERAGVFSRDRRGAIYSRRMVRDMGEREAARIRQHRHRNREHQEGRHVPVTSLSRGEAETETEKKQSKEKGAGAVCMKPSLPTVEAYASEIGLPVTEAARFVDYYTGNGWRVGRNAMKNWQAALRNWKRNFDERKAGKINATANRNTGTFNDGKANTYAKAAR